MPIHEYTCKECGAVNEFLVGIGRNSDDLTCKTCGSASLESRLSVPAPPQVQGTKAHPAGSTCCGGAPSDQGCVPGSCCGKV
ncbi:MAG: zinc ribbon domain-containing protein [Thermodesulfobacteriota bacterium]